MKIAKNAGEIMVFSFDKPALKLAVLSDTHAYLDHCVASQVEGCDAILHCGDICHGSIIKELEAICPNVIAIAGNNDVEALWPQEQSQMVNNLPDYVRLKLPGGDVYLEHGHRFGNHPDHDELRTAWPDARLVIYGHTHKMVLDQSASPWIINPGAAGRTRTRGGASCVLLQIDGEEWSIVMHRFDDECNKLVDSTCRHKAA